MVHGNAHSAALLLYSRSSSINFAGLEDGTKSIAVLFGDRYIHLNFSRLIHPASHLKLEDPDSSDESSDDEDTPQYTGSISPANVEVNDFGTRFKEFIAARTRAPRQQSITLRSTRCGSDTVSGLRLRRMVSKRHESSPIPERGEQD